MSLALIPTPIQERIALELRRIESERNVRVLYACESGSRAWGFESQDSDFDVRFLYVHDVDWYLTIGTPRDVIEEPITDELDISGWDLRKALILFRKSNPALFEWLRSPIVYLDRDGFAERLNALRRRYFSPRSGIYHYRSMAARNYREYLQRDVVKIKKYFYVLRPVLASLWIERFDEAPPMLFETLLDEFLPRGSSLRGRIDVLLERKRAGDELDLEPRVHEINMFIESEMERLDRVVDTLPVAEDLDKAALDDLFRSVVYGS